MIWLNRYREVGIEDWLTMRINDCHGWDCVYHEKLGHSEIPEIKPFPLTNGYRDSRPEKVGFYLAWEIPDSVLHPVGNIAVLLSEHVPGSVVWAEVLLLPDNGI